MYGKLRKNIGFSLIVFAFFFLFEPSYGLFDPLPDIIGYTILSIALTNLADINDRIMTALKGFLKCIILCVMRISFSVILDRLFVSDEQAVGTLIFSFLLAFFEIAISVPSYKALFEGLLSLGIFNDGEAVYQKKRKDGRNRTEKLYSLTLAFVIIKNIVCALPDFFTLQNNGTYEFIVITRILAIMIVAPLSVAWLISIVSYFVALKLDKKFVESLTQKYIERSASSSDIYIYRPIGIGLSVILVALILSFDIYSQDVNYLPDLFFFAAIIISVLIIREHKRLSGALIITSIIGTALSLFLFIVEREFFDRHFISAIKRDFEAYEHYYFMLALYVIQALISIAAIILIAFLIKEIFKKHALKEGLDSTESKLLQRNLVKRLIAFVCLGVASQIATVYHIFSLPYFNKGWFFEYSGVISSVISIGFILFSWLVMGYVKTEIKNRYRLDY